MRIPLERSTEKGEHKEKSLKTLSDIDNLSIPLEIAKSLATELASNIKSSLM